MAVDHASVGQGFIRPERTDTVQSTSKSGGPITIYASAQSRPLGIALDQRFLYWSTDYGGTVMRESIDSATDGGAPLPLATG